MENRVLEVELNDKIDGHQYENIVVKFYRPGRWSKDQIQEEHDFLLELSELEIPVVAPMKIENETLHYDEHTNLFFTLFPKQGGRLLSEFNEEQYQQLGRLIGRIHRVGAQKKYQHRLKLDVQTYGEQGKQIVLNSSLLPDYLRPHYEHHLKNIMPIIDEKISGLTYQRVHGDCHQGNVIWRENQCFLIDFDDTVSAPIAQDLWLLLPTLNEQDKNNFFDAYDEMNELPYQQLQSIEYLRLLRMIHFHGWVCKRWEDQAFQRNFAHFNTPNYWQTHIQDIAGQVEKILNPNSTLY